MKKLGMLFCVLATLGASPAFAARAAPAAAPARTGSGRGLDGQLSVFAILGYSYYYANAYGIGARYQKVLAPDVLRAKIHDDIAIEGGLDVVYSSWDYPWGWGTGYYSLTGTYTAISPVVGVLWNFWLNDKISLYPKLDLGYEFGSLKWTSSDPYWSLYSPYFRAHNYGGPYLDLAGGLAFKADTVTLRVQAGIHGLYLGLGFQL